MKEKQEPFCKTCALMSVMLTREAVMREKLANDIREMMSGCIDPFVFKEFSDKYAKELASGHACWSKAKLFEEASEHPEDWTSVEPVIE